MLSAGDAFRYKASGWQFDPPSGFWADSLQWWQSVDGAEGASTQRVQMHMAVFLRSSTSEVGGQISRIVIGRDVTTMKVGKV